MAQQIGSDRSVTNHQPDGVVLPSAPSRRVRVVVNVFIISWLVWQLVVPLSYYLGNNMDDERFAWRMFSGVWLLQKSCTASLTEVRVEPGADAPRTRRINLERTVHGTWVSQLKKKNRQLVVEKFVQARCEGDPSVTEIEYIRACPAASASRIPPVARRFNCRAGGFTGS